MGLVRSPERTRDVARTRTRPLLARSSSPYREVTLFHGVFECSRVFECVLWRLTVFNCV